VVPEARDAGIPAIEPEAVERLVAMGYLSHVPDEQRPGVEGVTHHDRERAYPGVTIFGQRRGESEAYLYDMDGRELHRWNPKPQHGQGLLWLAPARDGNLWALAKGGLFKMTWDSKILWEAPHADYHHDVVEDDAGRLYAMTHVNRRVQHNGQSVPVTDDVIVIFSPDGTVLDEISVLELVGHERISEELLQHGLEISHGGVKPRWRHIRKTLAADSVRDVFHLNSLTILDRDIGVGRAGQLLICLRSLDLILIVDADEHRVVWEWTAGQQELDRPHRPVLLDNDNILIFDNGWRRGHTRLLELDPRAGRIVWQFEAEPREWFFTEHGGMAQPLPGGNFLITETLRGRVFEITRAGELVWELWNPRHETKGVRRRQTIYRASRWGSEVLEQGELPPMLRRKLASRGYLGQPAQNGK